MVKLTQSPSVVDISGIHTSGTEFWLLALNTLLAHVEARRRIFCCCWLNIYVTNGRIHRLPHTLIAVSYSLRFLNSDRHYTTVFACSTSSDFEFSLPFYPSRFLNDIFNKFLSCDWSKNERVCIFVGWPMLKTCLIFIGSKTPTPSKAKSYLPRFGSWTHKFVNVK
jgi:hypothetical protein